MKIKYWIPILLIMLVFGFTGCNAPKVVTVATIAQTETTVAETTVVETTIPETTVVTTAETATETTTDVITASGNPEAFKDAWKKIIEDDGSNKVTKITFSDDGLTLYLNYNNTGDSPDAVEMQMYVFLTIMAMNNSNLNVALNGTWRMTTTYHSYTSTENMVRIKNFDLSYDDWVKVAIETTVPETTIQEVTETTEDYATTLRDIVKEYIEDTLEGKLTKFNLADDFSLLTISYNSMWSSEDRIKKEMFDLISVFSGSKFPDNYDIELTATGESSGDSYKSFNSKDTLLKLHNYEMDYPEWLKATFK